MNNNSLTVVVGGQYGSEGKGHVTHRVIRDRVERHRASAERVVNIRVAGPNAGHTVVTDEGTALPLRTIPVGVATPGVRLHIAAGSEVDLDVLASELEMVREAGLSVAGRMTIDPAATLLTPEHIEWERNYAMTARLGSTSKGIGAARVDRLRRSADTVGGDHKHSLRVAALLAQNGIQLEAYEGGRADDHVVIEGTQGYGLGLHTENYPYTTSSDCRAIDFLAMAGISPWQYPSWALTVWVVARPNPIRVAGNSGQMKGETSWDELGLPAEYTTVTHKVRRVGEWDAQLVRAALRANGINPESGRRDVVRLAVTMVDQVVPEVRGLNSRAKIFNGSPMSKKVMDTLDDIVEDVNCRVSMITTGPNTGVFL